MKKKHTHYRSFFNPATGGQLHPHRLLPLVLFIPLVILALAGFALPAEAAAEKSPPLSTLPPGVQVYEQADVNCTNPQYPPATLPFSEERIGGSRSVSKTLYLCSSGAHVHLDLFAGYLGYGGATAMSVGCQSGGCSNFRSIRGEAFTLWANTPFACSRNHHFFQGNIYGRGRRLPV